MAFLLSHAHNTINFLLLIGLLIFPSYFYLCVSSANNTITSSTSITDKNHETITSNNTDFKLGFFSPPNSTNRYLGIWYLNESYIIWIANRDNPLNDSSGVVKLHKDGNLVILNAQNSLIWSTNISTSSSSSIINPTAQLYDTGNLILSDVNSGATIWDSFTHPADAAVPLMKIAGNKVTGKKIAFVSRKSDSDPSSGHFTGSLERLDAPEVFLWHDNIPYWRTGPWNGRIFLGSPRMSTEYLFGWRLDHEDDGTAYLTYNFANPSMFGILSVTSHGKLKLVEFINKKVSWKLEFDQTECDFYGKCGPFGNCDNSSIPICSCLKGFEPRNVEEWSRKNWTSGCVRLRILPLQCENVKNGSSEVKQDGFLVYNNMKVPDFSERSDGDQDKCGRDCLANCSCLAHAYDIYIGCMYWSGNLIDLQHFPFGGVDLHIRVPAKLVVVKKKSGHKALIIGIAGAFGACTIVVCGFLVWRKCNARHKGVHFFGQTRVSTAWTAVTNLSLIVGVSRGRTADPEF